jgi:hypothetical protein
VARFSRVAGDAAERETGVCAQAWASSMVIATNASTSLRIALSFQDAFYPRRLRATKRH